ncbi:phloem protein 2-like protein [Tanacetum coccineum]|uniref:Phloem protein 2-like protein n=1 Tax=Tanacetum coccineum TaxID=301880 RepID=A0ABQ5ITL1_9ASTR
MLKSLNLTFASNWEPALSDLDLTTLNQQDLRCQSKDPTLYVPIVEPPKEGQLSNAQAVQAVKAWKHSDFLWHNYVLNGLVDSLYNVYYKTMTAKELWEALERKYKNEDVGTKKFVVAQFLDYKMVDSKNVIMAAIIEKLPPSWVEFKNYLKHKRKEMSVEDLVVHHKKGKGKSEYLAPKAGIVKQKFQGTCYNCDQPGHRAANCKMPKRANPRQANMVDENVDMIAMVSDVCAMISEVNLVGTNNSGWWIDTGATRHVCADKSMFHSFRAVDLRAYLFATSFVIRFQNILDATSFEIRMLNSAEGHILNAQAVQTTTAKEFWESWNANKYIDMKEAWLQRKFADYSWLRNDFDVKLFKVACIIEKLPPSWDSYTHDSGQAILVWHAGSSSGLFQGNKNDKKKNARRAKGSLSTCSKGLGLCNRSTSPKDSLALVLERNLTQVEPPVPKLVGSKTISLEEVKSATNHFSKERVIGSGASRQDIQRRTLIFKKSIPVAVKRFNRARSYGEGAFLKEVWLSLSEDGKAKEMVSATVFSYEKWKLAIERVEEYSHPTLRQIIDAGDEVKDKKVVFLAWMAARCFEEKKQHSLIFDDIMKQTDVRSVDIVSEVAYKCLQKDQEKRPTMPLVIHVEGEESVVRSINADSSINWEQQPSSDFQEIMTRSQYNGEKLFSLSKMNCKKCHMLPAKAVINKSLKAEYSKCQPSATSRFEEVIELQRHRAFSINCNIETQMLSPDTAYACYLVFQLPQNSEGLMCPVKAQDLLNKNNKDTTIIYLRAPCPVDLYRDKRVPENREDGWMEVRVWEFVYNNEIKDNYIPMKLKLVCLGGTMSGLIICGVEFRPI